MATKKFSEITQVNTVKDDEYIVVNTKTGPMQILKADFISLMVEAMPVATNKVSGLMTMNDMISRAYGVSKGDANEFSLGMCFANNCSNVPASYCYVLTVGYMNGSEPNRAQLALGYNSPVLKSRYRFGGVWSSWT